MSKIVLTLFGDFGRSLTWPLSAGPFSGPLILGDSDLYRSFHAITLNMTKKSVPVHRVSFWRGVLRETLLRRLCKLKFQGQRKRQLLRSLLSDPLPEGHPVDRDSFFLVNLFLTN